MASNFASWSFFFCVLLLAQCILFSSGRKMVLKPSENIKVPETAMDIDPSLNVFFKVDDLKAGKRMPIFFSIKNPSSSPRLLPREEADSIPFSSEKHSDLLDFFSFPENSPQAKAMKYTLNECELPPLRAETKFCATSLESMLDSAAAFFGSGSPFKALSTSHLTGHTVALQNYTLLEPPAEMAVSKMVGCHPMPYPYAVFYCHGQDGDRRLFRLALGGDNGERVEAFGVCHVDTSEWDPDHVAFRVLKTSPGRSPVCHFFPADNIIWVAMASPSLI